MDPAKTVITYLLEGWPHRTQGTFTLKHGAIRIDPATGAISGEITVDAASGNSGHSVRDERMRSSVLEADRFPEISFAPTRIVGHGTIRKEFPVIVRGTMRLRGIEHELIINAVIVWEGNDVTIRCTFSIPYVEWGLKYPGILIFTVSKEVDVSLTAGARLNWTPQ